MPSLSAADLPPAVNAVTDSETEAAPPSFDTGAKAKPMSSSWVGETGKINGVAQFPDGVTHAIVDGPVVFEVFAGCGNLSHAMEGHGLKALRYDLLTGHDMHSADFVNQLLQKVDALQCKYMHLAPPCNTYSQARYPKIRTCVGMFHPDSGINAIFLIVWTFFNRQL